MIPLGTFFAGFAIGIGLAAPPGPVMAIMATEAARGRVRRSLVTAWGAITGDAVWLAVAALGFIAFLQARPPLIGALGLVGAALLCWMAWGTWRSARAGLAESTKRGGYLVGLATVLTSPYSFAWWLANGALLISQWGAVGIAGMFVALLLYTLAFTYGIRWLGARFERTAHAVAYASVALLTAFAVYVAYASLRLLGGGAA